MWRVPLAGSGHYRAEGEAERAALLEQREIVRTTLAARDDETTTLAATRAMNERDEARDRVFEHSAAETDKRVARARREGAREERRLCLCDIDGEIAAHGSRSREGVAMATLRERLERRAAAPVEDQDGAQ